MLETDPHAADAVAASLEAAGHEVVRCFGPEGGSFPCNALVAESRCPVDDGIDVALVLRARPWPRPMPLERGAVCALRARIPLIAAGNRAFDPWTPWAWAELEGTEGIVAACEAAALHHR
jgi:hypothetical protein